MNTNTRKNEIKQLRGNGLTLQAIASRYNISRERVRQIIDSSVKRWEYTTAPIPHTKQQPGYVACGGPVLVGITGEIEVKCVLERNGYIIHRMPVGHPFDLLCNDVVRIDVKSAYRRFSPPSRGTVSPCYSFHVGYKDKRRKCDLIVLFIAETNDVFIIPQKNIKLQTNKMSFVWPTLRPELSKWQKYHNRFDLIDAMLE